LFTGVAHGDQRPVIENGASAPTEIPSGLRVAGLRQVHGSDVAVVDIEGDLVAADAALARGERTVTAVLVADCLPIALGSPEGIHASVHAGWRGLSSGVVENAVAEARVAGASSVVAALGPSIGRCCYEFSRTDLDDLLVIFGPDVEGRTTWGNPSLDLRAGARKILELNDVQIVHDDPSCTACGRGWYSARARKETERQAVYVWSERAS
jgi:hypothetical protein